MFKRSLLLLVALSLLVSIDAITAPAARSAIKLPASGGEHDKRSLRGFMSDDETTTEERAAVGGVQKLKSLLSKTKLGEKIVAIQKARLDRREEFVKNLVARGGQLGDPDEEQGHRRVRLSTKKVEELNRGFRTGGKRRASHSPFCRPSAQASTELRARQEEAARLPSENYARRRLQAFDSRPEPAPCLLRRPRWTNCSLGG
ncbi:hypothetical protein PF008_g29321, partial [Phytophthora fragariae]